ncbi:50S ribosomal protein L15 [Blastocystis sp. ATCC 50177/Nand II]|uniref:50S ribosomal protein L15 n=1 Tax=Blastocystis sp. subtype 1 (strain ATCC 50177 / NandII) TaxID=478820 RepID=A0A196SI08_BLAHN|nr:50S ribosomal protein L15 [Blastocystis sp. ATCC 50177/Nand II]
MFSVLGKRAFLFKPLMGMVKQETVCCCFSSAVSLNTLADNPGAKKRRTRVGRGNAAGQGTTAGKGKHGQNSRSGPGPYIGFIGGQTPIYRRIPKVGFTFAMPLEPLNLGRLQQWIDAGRIDPTRVITMKDLLDSKAVHGIQYGVKLLADGKESLHSAIRIDVTRASKEAIAAVEKNGGQVICSHYNRLALRMLLKPDRFVPPYPLRARPPPKLMGYYLKDENRGYLSPSYSATYQEFVKDMHKHGYCVSPNGRGQLE